MTDDKLNEIIRLIDKQIEELNNIEIEGVEQNLRVAKEDLKRWKSHVETVITNNISPEEGENFKNKRKTQFSLHKFKDFQDEVYLYKAHLESLKKNLEKYHEEMLHAAVKSIDCTSMRVTREGVFFSGQHFDALMLFSDILSNAQQNILLIDGYIDKSVLNLLTAKKKDADVSILTFPKSITPALKTAAEAFNKQYKNLSIRTSQAFHDRFVIVDDNNFYHFGASFKDLGKRGFMFSHIEEPDEIRWGQISTGDRE